MDDLQHEPANPQLENGHTRIANEILEALCRYRIPGEEMQCLLVVIRKTYGFGKKSDFISKSQFAAITGIKRPNVTRALNSLVSKKILAVIKKDTTEISNYSINKDYYSWLAGIKKDTTPRQAGIKKDTALVSKKIPTKETLTKEIKSICPKPEKASAPNSPTFEGFYSAYPKHKAKPAAEKAWKKLNPSQDLFEKMIKALEWQCKQPDWLKDNGQYIPLPASWLNGQRWLDEAQHVDGLPEEGYYR